VCRNQASADKSFSISTYTPVIPKLSSYPPPGIFVDKPSTVKNKETATQTTVPVVTLTWSWIEMVSTSALDLLAPLTNSKRLQAKIDFDFGTRGINSSFTFVDSGGSSYAHPWPSCDSIAEGSYEPLLSFVISYQSDSPSNQSYIVSETSLVSWAFATLITLGSVIALKNSLTIYLDKLSNYWRMKQWVRWVLFTLYTLLMPIPMLFVLFKFITSERLAVRGANYQYYQNMSMLLIIMASLLMATWIGVLIRHLNTAHADCLNCRKKREEQFNLVIEYDDKVKNEYEQIK